VVPYLTLGVGAVVFFMVIKRLRGTKPMQPAVAGAAPPHDPILERYRDAIEKDTDDLN
jgi:hypothetical protein